MEANALLIAVMRSLGTTWRALRLYPAASPMTLQAAQALSNAVEEYLQAEPSLKLDVVREGFILRGLDGVLTAPGVSDFTDALGLHGVGELHFVAPPAAEEVVSLMAAAQLRPQDMNGTMQSELTKAGVGSIKLVAVVLSKIETPPEIPEDEADKFLAELAADSARLAVWLASLLASDDEGLAEGILLLASAAEDVRVFGRTMAGAFMDLESGDRDRLLEASIGLPPIRHILVEMLANLADVELVAAIRGGRYGTSLMALSFALAHLPVGERVGVLLRETQDALSSADSSEEQVALLTRMVALRRTGSAEVPVTEANKTFGAVLEGVQLAPSHHAAVEAALTVRRHIDANSVATMLHLLDTADNLRSYSRVVGALARSVPQLLETQGPELAMFVVRRISAQETESSKPWPELQNRVEAAMADVCTTRTMAALLALSSSDLRAIESAKELVALTDDRAATSLAAAALASETEDAMPFAQAVIGKRLAEMLVPEAATADERSVARLAELFATDGGPTCMQALATLVSRPEDRVRAEAARGLAAAGGTAMMHFMPQLLRDPSTLVSGLAIRVSARNGSPGAEALLGRRLAEIDNEKDLPAAREIISLLANFSSDSTTAALKQAAESGSVLKRRAWRSEMRQLALQALTTIDARRQA